MYASQLLLQLSLHRALKAAATIAIQTICKNKWTVEDPRCCSTCCRNSGKTGIWAPRHVPLRSDLPEADVVNVQNLWWRNALRKQPSEISYNSSDPQKRVSDFARTKQFYVVCSEVCGNSVTKALETIRLARESERLLDARDDFEIKVILGVDKLVLSGDVEEIQDSD